MTAVGFFQFSSRNFGQTGIISYKVRLAYLLAYSAASVRFFAEDPDREREYGYCTNIDLA